jgi:hypothetical protein
VTDYHLGMTIGLICGFMMGFGFTVYALWRMGRS